MEIVPRSSIGLKTPLRQPNSIGIIDSDYRGEVKAMYEAPIGRVQRETMGRRKIWEIDRQYYQIKAGDRIAQMKLCKKYDADLVEVDELSETERGEGGFGSTGAR